MDSTNENGGDYSSLAGQGQGSANQHPPLQSGQLDGELDQDTEEGRGSGNKFHQMFRRMTGKSDRNDEARLLDPNQNLADDSGASDQSTGTHAAAHEDARQGTSDRESKFQKAQGRFMSLFRRNKDSTTIASQQATEGNTNRSNGQQEANGDDVPPEVLRASQIQATPDLIENETIRLLNIIVFEEAKQVDWTTLMTLIDGLNEVEAESIVRATMVTFLSEKLLTGVPKELILCLIVIEATIQNYNQFFKSLAEDGLLGAVCLVGSDGPRETVVIDEFADSPRGKALALVQRWAEIRELQSAYPQFHISYTEMKQSGIEFPPKREGSLPPIFTEEAHPPRHVEAQRNPDAERAALIQQMAMAGYSTENSALPSRPTSRVRVEEQNAPTQVENDGPVQISVAELISRGTSTADILWDIINSDTIEWSVVDEIAVEVEKLLEANLQAIQGAIAEEGKELETLLSVNERLIQVNEAQKKKRSVEAQENSTAVQQSGLPAVSASQNPPEIFAGERSNSESSSIMVPEPAQRLHTPDDDEDGDEEEEVSYLQRKPSLVNRPPTNPPCSLLDEMDVLLFGSEESPTPTQTQALPQPSAAQSAPNSYPTNSNGPLNLMDM